MSQAGASGRGARNLKVLGGAGRGAAPTDGGVNTAHDRNRLHHITSQSGAERFSPQRTDADLVSERREGGGRRGKKSLLSSQGSKG
eukprot:2968237-Pleurochrysis_carterae.AAC.1